ncbi:MAG: 4Fe-4S binding protein [Chloroflexi bacterium]|nr:4Fe-4S binding protein [Chloroflexota bacterium]
MNVDLLKNRTLRAFLISGLYPGVFQAITAGVFVVVIFQLITGPSSTHDNFGMALTWVLWWPIIPIIFVVLGRFWCAICPFGTLSDLVQKIAGKKRAVPAFLKKYGIWIIDFLFILITWADHIWGIVDNPIGSAVLLLAITAGVIISGAFFMRRTWCRYLCFLGGLAGNYSRSGMVALRANEEVCVTCKARAACYNGNEKGPGCPMFEFPRQLDSNAQCNFCADCLKTCPNDAIQITVRPPTQELWFIRKPKFEEAFLAIIIMGIVLVQNITMLEVWGSMLQTLQQITGTTDVVINFTITFLIAMAIPLALFALAAFIARRFNGDSFSSNFGKFGYAIIPLDIAGHMAHNLFHLLAEGKSVVFTAQTLVGHAVSTESAALLPTPTIQVLQYALLAVGALGSVYAVYAIAKNHYVQSKRWGAVTSYSILIVVFLSINGWLFAMPMSMRMHQTHSHGIPEGHEDPSQWYDDPNADSWPRKLNMDSIFPPSEGRELTMTVCTSCHSFIRIVYGHHSHSHSTGVPGEDTHWDPHRVRHEPRFKALTKEQIDTIYVSCPRTSYTKKSRDIVHIVAESSHPHIGLTIA